MARPADPYAKMELLQAAQAVFVEHGLDVAKVEQITARAKRSKGSFYQHFDSKEEAFQQIVDGVLAQLVTRIDEAIVPEGEPPPDRDTFVARWVDKVGRVYEHLWENRGVVGLLLSGGHSAAHAYLIDAFFDRSRANIRSGLEEGMALGVFRPDLDLDMASLVMAGAYDRLARHLVAMTVKPDLRAWSNAAQDVILRGVLNPDRPVNKRSR